jgi:uncharacterized membrane protein
VAQPPSTKGVPPLIPASADPFIAASSEVLGGLRGRFARIARDPWRVISILIILAASGYALGYLLDASCISNGWIAPDNYEHLCYSDIPALYGIRGFAEGAIPYVQMPSSGTPLEYPVLTGLFMWVASLITSLVSGWIYSDDSTRSFFDVNVILLTPFLLITVIASALAAGRRVWDAAMIAVAPLLILGATINWDLIPVALTALAFLNWTRNKPQWAGVFLGCAIAAKFYPVVLLAVFIIIALRSWRWRPTLVTIAATAITWLLINLPFVIANFDGWFHFYSFNSARGMDFGSFWYAITLWGAPAVPAEALNAVGALTFLALLAVIAFLALRSPIAPTAFQLGFLVIAAFAISGKVYSPQYVLWLIPFAVLAYPRWRDFLIWQTGQLIYFAAIWWHLAAYGFNDAKGLHAGWYAAATFIQIGSTLWFAALIIRDMYRSDDHVSATASKVEVVKRTSAPS